MGFGSGSTTSSSNAHGAGGKHKALGGALGKALDMKGRGQSQIDSTQASLTQAEGPSPIRSVHLHNLTDVRDLLTFVRAEKDAIDRNAASNSVEHQRRSRKLGWVLKLLGKQYAVLKRITHPNFRRMSHNLPDLLEHKVTKAFPFRFPVLVNITHTTGRLTREHIERICGAFDLTTHQGVRDCIAWLGYQVAQLKTSPIHYQPREQYGPTESAFLVEISDLLDALRARLQQVPPPPPPPLPLGFIPRTPKRVKDGGEKTVASEGDGDWSPKSPSYSPGSAAESTPSSVSSPLTENGCISTKPVDDCSGDWDEIEPFSPSSTSVSANEVVSDEIRASPVVGRVSKVMEELGMRASSGRAKEDSVLETGEGQSKDGAESRGSEEGQVQQDNTSEDTKACVGAGEEDELEEGEIVEE